MYFDDSRMFDALRVALASPTNSLTKIICFRTYGYPYALPRVAIEGVAAAACLLGAADFLDLEIEKEGGRGSDAEILALFERWVGSDKIAPKNRAKSMPEISEDRIQKPTSKSRQMSG